jgi:hypothetical protein
LQKKRPTKETIELKTKRERKRGGSRATDDVQDTKKGNKEN